MSLSPIVAEDVRAIAALPLPYDRLARASVAVSGAAGFIASHLVEALLFLNEAHGLELRVLGLVRNRDKAEARFAHHRGRGDLELISADVCEPWQPARKLDFIVHAASHASPKHYGSDPVGTLLPNVLGTHNLLELARRDRAELLFISGGEAYGVLDPAQIPTAERAYGAVDSASVRACYAESKRMGETMCIAFHHQHAVAAKIARLFHTYGPGLALDDGRVFADFVADLLHGRDLTLQSDGSARRTYCYVADAIAGLLTVLLAGGPGEVYNVGSPGPEVSVLELAQQLVELFPEKRLTVKRAARPHAPGYIASPYPRICPDTRKLEALGWRPRHSIASGFRRTLASYA